MNLFEKFLSRFGYSRSRAFDPGRPPRMRDYDLAKVDRLTQSFLAPITTGDVELRTALIIMRARSRELERNNDYARKFLNMCKVNVVGKTGFTLKNKARDPKGTLDKGANGIIESEWALWGKKDNCTVDGQLSWIGEQELFIKTVARDGEFLARKIRGFGNPWKFAIQNLEADLLNEYWNRPDSGGQNLIKMGIEYDEWNRPVAYHLRKKHPGDYFRSQFSANTYEIVPAKEIIHCFVPERSTQGRGIPWMHTAARRLNQLGEYEYAEVIAARVAASKMGFFTKQDQNAMGYIGDDKDKDGNFITDAEPGTFEDLPPGYDFKAFLPDHPTSQFNAFIKASLRGVSSGLNVSYNSLANDLEGVNFSSMRSGAIEERDNWKQIQAWMIDSFITQVYEDWLDMLLLTNRTYLPYSKFDKFNSPAWRGRIFDWVDPEKDINAEIKMVRAGWKTNEKVVSERMNMDLEEVYEQLSEEKKLADKYDLHLDLSEMVSRKPAVTEPVDPNNPGGV